ncbi:MAG: dienelactone hydrolase family protein [Gammaproteobacteria bacterium]|nr:dienelactone hydrolase family protein [Gammaproteobacteria bacterium]MCP5137525.1 dienelactone hydrolase family protein [Gammaproteobacteria bacterium]
MPSRATLVVACLILVFGGVTAQAELEKQAVDFQIDGEPHQGYLVWDNAFEGKRPGVMVVHEWWGLNDYAKYRAEEVAKLGYVAFAADMYGTGKSTDTADQAREWMQAVTVDVEEWRNIANANLAQLKAQPTVDPDKVAAIGYCFGGGTVLQMAYGGLDVLGVVSFHGSLPSLPKEDEAKLKAHIDVEHGGADPFVPAEQLALFKTRLDEVGADYVFHEYPGVKHSFTNPGADKRGMAALQYDENADHASWENMKTTLERLFR